VAEVIHPSQRLDEVVHQRVRLGILAVLAEADQADFAYLKEALGLTDGNLSRHLQVLETGGLVRITKAFEGRRPRTWVASTSLGRAAFAAEVAALRELMAVSDDSATDRSERGRRVPSRSGRARRGGFDRRG
jgi:DNA-binding MarR family transcriptional regulator